MQYRVLAEKLKEAAASVLPVTAIVAVLCLALVRVDVGLMLSFLLGSGLLILGMGGAAAWHFFKNKMPDRQTQGDTDLDDYDYGIDEDDDLDYDTEEEQEEQH